MTGNIKTHPFFKTINWTLLEKRAVEPPFKPKVVREPVPVGAASSVLPPMPSGVGISSFALPLSCLIYVLSSSPLCQQTGLPGTCSHDLFPRVLILSLLTQSFSKHWELCLQPPLTYIL